MKKEKFLSGEFARICQVNKKTLFYYDEIDLFKPAIVEQNGYRYYTYDQIDEFSKIKALQSVGLSLTDIKINYIVIIFQKESKPYIHKKGPFKRKFMN